MQLTLLRCIFYRQEMEIAIEHERRRARQAEQQRVDEETRLKQQRAKDREKELNKLKQFKREMMMAKRKDEQGICALRSHRSF